MRPRPALLLGALIAPALPLLTAGPGQAVAPIICVNRPGDTDCGPRPTTIPAAIGIANTDDGDSIIRIGPGTYTDGPYTFDDQKWSDVAPMIDLMPGDQVSVDCSYENTTNQAVSYGDSSNAEMCFAGLFVYPPGAFGLICDN